MNDYSETVERNCFCQTVYKPNEEYIGCDVEFIKFIIFKTSMGKIIVRIRNKKFIFAVNQVRQFKMLQDFSLCGTVYNI